MIAKGAQMTTNVILAFLSVSFVRAEAPPTFGSLAEPFLAEYCLDCHDAETQKGDISLEELSAVNSDNAELWKSVWEQVALKQMPPKDKKNQPELIDRWQLSNWITGEMERVMKGAGGFHTHLHPTKGNHLDHDLLFGDLPEGLEPPSTPSRIWRVHPQEHLVRLKELIDFEPEFDPEYPGVRTRGDAIPWNQDGEVKVYYGLDQITDWAGGTAAYAAAITGFPPVLTTIRDPGLKNFANLYSVNGAEATQIASIAEDILQFMAFGPKGEPWQFVDDPKDLERPAKYDGLDIRGTTESLTYKTEPARPLTPVHDLMAAEGVPEEKLRAAVAYLFEKLTFRPPTEMESNSYIRLAKEAVEDLGKKDGLILGLTPIFLDGEALFRYELAKEGEPDAHGRVMLQDWELAVAINGAFCYLAPTEELRKAVLDGRLRTREDVGREVARILADDSIRKPRVLQFFREYFDYDQAGRVCKDTAALRAAGGGTDNRYYRVMFRTTTATDRLIELILAEDRDVLSEILTTDQIVIQDDGNAEDSDAQYLSHFENRNPNPRTRAKKDPPLTAAELGYFDPPDGKETHVRISEDDSRYYGGSPGDMTRRSLTTLPADQRMGILTHPGWLVAHSDAMDNHAIHRGKWIRERLLGGAVPDVPITVDAQLPDEPEETLRHRMRVTHEEYCWKCHQKMDPLGLPFEMYNHIGMCRTTEQGRPVDTTGEIIDSGDPALDGPVANALEMIGKLAGSERVEQVFVRHAFRYWMGRNETLNDAPVLQDAWHAYRDTGGSMKALITSLVTSDAFLYRKVERAETTRVEAN